MLVACATLASLFPFVGTIVYMIVRPPEYLDDVRLRELEMQAAEARLPSSTTSCARTATTRSSATSCAARAACASSRTPARTAASRSTRRGALPVLRGRAGRRRRRPRAPGAAGDGADGRARPRSSRASRAAPTLDTSRRSPPMDRTLILVKPDAFARGLTGEIIARFERKGLRIVALKLMTLDRAARRAALRRARRQAVLRRARRLHHLGPAGGDGARGPRGREGRAPGDRRHEPARGGAPARSAATSRSRSARTWSTAPTPRESAEREAALFFPSWLPDRSASSALAAAARDPRAARRRRSTSRRPTSRS